MDFQNLLIDNGYASGNIFETVKAARRYFIIIVVNG